MKLKIVGKPLALCRIDMKQFRLHFSKTLDLRNSINANFEVVEKGRYTEEELFKYAYFGLNWGRILDLINEIDKDEMDIRYFKCEFEGKVEMTPDLVSEDGRLFMFRKEIKEGDDIIMINSFINSPDFDISSYLNSSTFNYGKVRWKPLMDYDKEKIK